jgi:IMP dehydrogenase
MAEPPGLLAVRDLAASPMPTVEPSATYAQVRELLADSNNRVIAVVDASRRLIGTLCSRDLAFGQMVAAELLMDSPVFSVQDKAPLDTAAQLLIEKRIDHIPIVDDVGIPLGLLVCADVLAFYFSRYLATLP